MQETRHRCKRKRKKPAYRPPMKSWDASEPTNDEGDGGGNLVGCTGKRRYPDLIAAHAAAGHMSELINSSEVYLYLCEHCKGYHLTKAKISPDGKLNRWTYFFGKG